RPRGRVGRFGNRAARTRLDRAGFAAVRIAAVRIATVRELRAAGGQFRQRRQCRPAGCGAGAGRLRERSGRAGTRGRARLSPCPDRALPVAGFGRVGAGYHRGLPRRARVGASAASTPGQRRRTGYWFDNGTGTWPGAIRTGRKRVFRMLAVAGLAFGAARADVVIPESLRSNIPPPDIEAESWMLQDQKSGWIIASHNADARVEPASISKLMTAYVVFDALTRGNIKGDDLVSISERAWRMEGSRMFVQVNTRVSVDDLLRGLIVQSGNDAAMALAEYVAGSEEGFVE